MHSHSSARTVWTVGRLEPDRGVRVPKVFSTSLYSSWATAAGTRAWAAAAMMDSVGFRCGWGHNDGGNAHDGRCGEGGIIYLIECILITDRSHAETMD